MVYEIYGIVNLINRKIYIGQTKQGYRKRFIQHLCPTDGSPLFRNAVKKYGKDSFECELIDVAYSQKEANEKEKLWIKLLGTYKKENGYNLSMGGCIGSFNDETLKRMSEAHKGSNNHFYGKHHTDETKKIMSEKKKGLYCGDKHPKARKVRCIDTGEIFNTIKDAEVKYKISHGKISCVCNGKYGRKTAGGYKWEWV